MIDKMVHNTHRKNSLFYIISAIKGKEKFKNKIAYIRERFPEYSNELKEVLKKETL